MKVLVTSASDWLLEERDFRDFCRIAIDGKVVFDVWDDEPEDSNLSRTFGPVFSIPDLMLEAYQAGRRGEPFEVESRRDDEM